MTSLPNLPGKIAQPLVSTSWLAEQLELQSSSSQSLAPRIVVLDGTWHMPSTNRSGRKEWEAERIKGSLFFDIDEVADKNTKLPHMLPTAEEFEKHVAAMGITNDTHVVVYDAVQGIGSAARVLWTFRVFGHVGGVSVLDGGLQRWKAEGRPVESGPPPVLPPTKSWDGQPVRYMAKLNKALVKNFEEVRDNLYSQQYLVVDARPAPRFFGKAPEPRPIPSGHIPRSVSLPSNDLIEAAPAPSTKDSTPTPTSIPPTPSLLRGSALSSALTAANIPISRPAIHSCGSGVNASITWLATIVARNEVAPGTWEELEDGLSVYDGSWTDWASRALQGADGAEIDSRGNF
ncbi:hypothetical protein HDV05_008615 [Chytridiales sp. JEL 0842]|nr:hypothetical protein HDV05_008615 [Chytridiales sp. JEL 0842]